MTLHFMTSGERSSARVGEISSGGWRFISPPDFLNLLWFDRTCLMIAGIYYCRTYLVCLGTLPCCLGYTHPVGCTSACQVPSLS